MLFSNSPGSRRRKPHGTHAASPRRPSRSRPFAVEALETRALMSVGAHAPVHAHLSQGHRGHDRTPIQQTNLVSDGAVPAKVTDPGLVNPWGLSASPTSPWWISDNGTGLSTLYNGNTGAKQGLIVSIPSPSGPTGGTPTGTVFNGTNSFVVSQDGKSGASIFLFATEDGTISGWNPGVNGTHAILAVDHSGSGAVYKGLATGTSGGANFLYATNFHSGKVEVFDTTFAAHTFSSKQFTDRHIPAGFAPFGIQNLNGMIFVTYARQDAARHDDVAGRGLGFVDVFSTGGDLIGRVASRGTLNSPWGLAVAPSSFGRLAGDLLVGNFGDGRINAFRMTKSGHFKSDGQLRDAGNHVIAIDGLWALAPGNGAAAGSSNALFFTAGNGGEKHGLFGTLTATT
ncbi:hypothetical protein OJF2_11910 [Aquisphaera giovannonii]|uniref:TIGR03118 family protein n=1 Tax=Aquisphaera giovannonii TaxID=406548 RepID=A0A5B9VWT0_9BACT|nr:TIGR03118 family protein [Aquisphaera giovannonii]QEH32712.1 hypothetical protein OJF2_11910 [Aquisphaera giovannonii]